MPRFSKISREDVSVLKQRLDRAKKIPNPTKIQDKIDPISASAKKIKLTSRYRVPKTSNLHFKTFDFLMVFSMISALVRCDKCETKMQFEVCRDQDLGFEIQVNCGKCSPRYIPSCKKIGKTYEINLRFIFVMRILGIGFTKCNKFCGLMDIASTFLSKTCYLDNMKKIQSFII